MSNTNVRGTSDMPAPQTMNYQASYKISQLFVNDFRRTFQEVSYADYKNADFYRAVEETIKRYQTKVQEKSNCN